MSPLVFVSRDVLETLRSDVPKNLERYASGDFADLVTQQWSLPTSFNIDLAALKSLNADGGVDAEVQNSLLVWKALPGFSPALATEGRIWTRLAHVECLEFSRKRWLREHSGQLMVGDILRKRVLAHFFGESLTRYRDDHSVGRYWWNAFYASRLTNSGLSVEQILKVLLHRADLRMNLLERTEMSSQKRLAEAVFKHLQADAALRDDEARFRTFMKNLNLRGGGMLFDPLSEADLLALVANCVPA